MVNPFGTKEINFFFSVMKWRFLFLNMLIRLVVMYIIYKIKDKFDVLRSFYHMDDGPGRLISMLFQRMNLSTINQRIKKILFRGFPKMTLRSAGESIKV